MGSSHRRTAKVAKSLPRVWEKFVERFSEALAKRSRDAGPKQAPAAGKGKLEAGASVPAALDFAYLGLVTTSFASSILTMSAVVLIIRLLAERKQEVRAKENPPGKPPEIG